LRDVRFVSESPGAEAPAMMDLLLLAPAAALAGESAAHHGDNTSFSQTGRSHKDK